MLHWNWDNNRIVVLLITFIKYVTVHFDGKIALQGPRYYFTILWYATSSASKPINPAQMIPNDSQNKEPVHDTATTYCNHMPTLFPLRPKLSKTVLGVLEAKRTKQELVKFLCVCYLFPFIGTWITVIANNNYASFLGLTIDLVKKKYLPISIPTNQGNMHQRWKGIRSTTARAAAMLLSPEPRVHESYFRVVELPGIMCINQTGRFPVRSRNGNNNLMIMYDYDSNDILADSMPDRKPNTLHKAFKILYNKICLKGYKPTIYKLDNEISTDYTSML